jgi:hypothetical protein
MAGSTEQAKREWLKCGLSCHYFLNNYCYIYDATQATWIPFHLWPLQVGALNDVIENRLTVILKARQLGQTWMVLGYALWKMLFHPSVTVLLFSRRDDEAQYLIERLKGIYQRLPEWMYVKKIETSSTHVWKLSNGSIVYGFPTTAGDSYTASLAIVDEADLVPDLGRLMNAVKPTIDGGGQMILLSRADKDNPNSEFKRIYKAAKANQNGWKSVFLPWYTRPERSQEWYKAQVADVMSRTGSLDDLWQQYPATDAEALVARTLAKRIPPDWVTRCYDPIAPLEDADLSDAPGIVGLSIYKLPEYGLKYVIGADPAEGNPTSDDSSLHVLERRTGEEVAKLVGKIEPSTFAGYIKELAEFYNDAIVLPERNNHGHTVIAWLKDNSNVKIVPGLDAGPGFQTNSKSKAQLYSNAADLFRDMSTVIHSESTFYQICNIEGSTLRAPDGDHDDEATSYVLALQATASDEGASFNYDYTKAKQSNRTSRALRYIDELYNKIIR